MLRFLLGYLDSGLLIVGLLLTLLGAWMTSRAVIIDEKTASDLAGTYWGSNERLKKALLDQSRGARLGSQSRAHGRDQWYLTLEVACSAIGCGALTCFIKSSFHSPSTLK